MVLIMYKYHQCHRYACQLVALKEDIRSYEQMQKKNFACGQQSKEKKNFLKVNRTLHYLRESAVDYAKAHNLEWAISELYDAHSWQLATQKTKTQKQASIKPRQKAVSFRRRKPLRQSTRKNSKVQHVKERVFSWPIDRSKLWISSPFGPRKKANGRWGFHYGIDLAAVKGTPVKASATGIVIEAGYANGYGNTVVIIHNTKFKTRYAHLNEVLVKQGQKVHEGTCIGKVGNTGSVRSKRGGDGTHLHFEVYVFNKQVNPRYFLS